MQFISHSVIDKNVSRHGMTEYLLVTELCEGNNLFYFIFTKIIHQSYFNCFILY